MDNAFITGSHVYGKPSESSDIDLAVLIPSSLSDFLWQNKDKEHSSCRFGKLNILTFTSIEKFNDWKRVTDELKTKAPVTREEAVKAFQEAGFTDYGQ